VLRNVQFHLNNVETTPSGIRLTFQIMGASNYAVHFLMAESSDIRGRRAKIIHTHSGYIDETQTEVRGLPGGIHTVVTDHPDGAIGIRNFISLGLRIDNVLDQIAEAVSDPSGESV
jgi:hypothetical protein